MKKNLRFLLEMIYLGTIVLIFLKIQGKINITEKLIGGIYIFQILSIIGINLLSDLKQKYSRILNAILLIVLIFVVVKLFII